VTKSEKTVYAKDARDKWVWRNPEDIRAVRVKIKTTRPAGRGFTKITYYHKTVGNHSEVLSDWERLDLAP
jgi:hypothetical protein